MKRVFLVFWIFFFVFSLTQPGWTEVELQSRQQLGIQLQLKTSLTLQYQERIENAFLEAQSETPPATLNQAAFRDIERHWAKAAISEAYLWGIVKGYPDGRFLPEGQITGLEAVLMLSGVLRGLDGIEPYYALDMDIDWQQIPVWAREALKDQSALRIMNQSQNYGSLSLNRHQFAVMLAKALEIQQSVGPDYGPGPLFSDLSQVPADGRGYIQALKNLGLVEGDQDRFEPFRLITRAEAVVMLMNVIHTLDTVPEEADISEDLKVMTLQLQENPSTGYSWNLEMSILGVLVKEGDTFLSSQTTGGMVGAGGVHIWTFKTANPGCTRLTFRYYRPWESPETAVEIRVYGICVNASGGIESIRRIR